MSIHRLGIKDQELGRGGGGYHEHVVHLGQPPQLLPRSFPAVFSTRQEGLNRCRANMAHIRQSRPYSGLGFEVKFRKPFQLVPSLLASGTKCSRSEGAPTAPPASAKSIPPSHFSISRLSFQRVRKIFTRLGKLQKLLPRISNDGIRAPFTAFQIGVFHRLSNQNQIRAFRRER